MAVERDCRASKHGVVYLMHDWKLDRFGDVIPKELKGRDVSHDLTWSQLKGLDVGSWRGEAWRGCHPPTFDDFLSQMKGRPTWLAYVHDKGAGPKRIAEKTTAAGLVGQVYYTTSDHDEILKWRQYLPDGRSLFWISSWLKDRSESERRRSDAHYREKFAQIRERNFEGINVVCLHVWGNVKDKVDRYIPSTPLLREMLGELKAHGIIAQIELHDAEDRDVQAFRDAYDFGFDCFITDHPSVMSRALDKIRANN